MDALKVFVGNLSYATTEEELGALFSQVGEPKVQLITRFGKSKGFGFVAFASQEQVDQAVQKFHGYDMDGRELNVEQARPMVEHPPREPRQRTPREPREPKDREPKEREPKLRKERAPREPREPRDDKEPREKRERKPRPERAERSDELSETMMFVGNLPFQVTSEDLTEMFQKYQVKSCRVVSGKFGRSKGFGFVDFQNHQGQQTALADFADAVVNDRTLVVKQAFVQQEQS